MSESIAYRDELPEGCPPEQAEIIAEARSVFHFVEGDPAVDFQSQRTMSPGKEFPGADECIARGISVFATRRAAASFLRAQLDGRRARQRRRWARKRICQVNLLAGAGAMLKTRRGQPSKDGQHRTWWPARDFDIAANAIPLSEEAGR